MMLCKARPIVWPVYIINRHELWGHDRGQGHKMFIYLFSFIWLLNDAIFLSKSIKPFSIYCQMKYQTFNFDLWLKSQGHKMLLFYLALYGYYMVQFLAKSFRIRSCSGLIAKWNTWPLILTFDLHDWPLQSTVHSGSWSTVHSGPRFTPVHGRLKFTVHSNPLQCMVQSTVHSSSWSTPVHSPLRSTVHAHGPPHIVLYSHSTPLVNTEYIYN